MVFAEEHMINKLSPVAYFSASFLGFLPTRYSSTPSWGGIPHSPNGDVLHRVRGRIEIPMDVVWHQSNQ